MLRLSSEDQDYLLSYCLLEKTQNQLAVIHCWTQTQCSTRIRDAVQRLAYLMSVGDPTADVMSPILTQAGLENALKQPVSQMIELYADTRDFEVVGQVFGLRRQDIRREMFRVAKLLNEETRSVAEQLLGAYIHGLIDRQVSTGTGWDKREGARQADVYVRHREPGHFTGNISYTMLLVFVWV